MRATLTALAAATAALLTALAARAEPVAVVLETAAKVRIPSTAAPLQPLWTGSFSGPEAFGSNLAPGPDHEAEGPPAIAASADGFAILDGLRGVVRFVGEGGSAGRKVSLDALGAEAASALDLAVDGSGAVALWLSRAPGSVAILDQSSAVSARAALDESRSPATGLVFLDRRLFAGYADARAWQPLQPLEPIRRGLPTPGGDCNAALLADGRAIVRCHAPEGLREVVIEPDPSGPALAAVEQVHADDQGGIAAVLAVRSGAAGLHRLAFRLDRFGQQAWADLGDDPPWFTARAAAFTADGRLLRLTGDAAGPRVLLAPLRPLGPRGTP